MSAMATSREALAGRDVSNTEITFLLHSHPMGEKLDLPRRPRLRGEQRAGLPCGDQLAECRWVAYLEDRLFSLLPLYRRAGSALGIEVLFSKRMENLRVMPQVS